MKLASILNQTMPTTAFTLMKELFGSDGEILELLSDKANKMDYLLTTADLPLQANTNLQPLFGNFGVNGDGSLSVEKNSLYSFDLTFQVSGLKASGAVPSIGFLGDATYHQFTYGVLGSRTSTGINVQINFVEGTARYTYSSSSTATFTTARVMGSFIVENSGKFQPNFGMSSGFANMVVEKGAFCTIQKLGSFLT